MYFCPNFQFNYKIAQNMIDNLIARDMSSTLGELFNHLPVLTVTGPRQSGKTTLCRSLFSDLPYVNLEDLSLLAQVRSDPKAFLERHRFGVIIDEAQNYPEIFSYLQVAVDNDRFSGQKPRRFVVTGSNNFSLMEKITQSMAGRTAVLSLLPLSTDEILRYNPHATTSELIINGGFPALWVAKGHGRRLLLSNYYTTYIERDVRQMLNVSNMSAFQQFVRLCAGRIGQEFNKLAISNEVGVSVNTISHWLSILNASYVTYTLSPYYANISKRLTKTPKLYFYDTGLAAYLMGINTIEQLDVHPLRGNLLENLVVNDFMKYDANRALNQQLHFYRDKSQHEVDLLRISGNGIEAYEIKSSKTWSSSFFRNLDYLKKVLGEQLTRSMLLYDGDQENPLNNNGYINFRNISQYLSS